MLQLIGFRKARMSSRYLTSVECQKIHKKSKKFPVTFELALSWSDGQNTIVERPYMAVFDFENVLKKTYPDCQIPHLKDARWFESLWKARKEEKKKALDEFFQKILSLPEKVVYGKEITEFFTFVWQRDSGSSEGTQQNSREADPRSHSTAVISPVESEYASIDAEKGDYSTLSIRPKSVAVFQNRISKDKDMNSTYWAVTEYSKRKSGEVDLTVGAVVNVLQRELSGWWFVHVEDTNEQGWAPGACLLPDDRTNLQDCSITGPFGEFQALRDFEGIEPDEVSCKKGERVEVIQASLDGWWEVRCRGKVGIIPATNLEPISSQAKFRSSLYHQAGIYKKDSPPPRRNSKLSVEELYGKVDKFRKNTNQSSSSPELGSKNKKAEPIKMSSVPPQVVKKKADEGDASYDEEHLYMNDSNASTKHSYVNVELKSKRNAADEKKYYRSTARHEPSIKHQHRPVLVAGIGDIIESHIEENNEIYGKLYRLADGSYPDTNEGWISKTCLELYELEPDDVMTRDVQDSNQRFSNVSAKKPIPPKRPQETKLTDAQGAKSHPKPLLNPRTKANVTAETSTSSQPSHPYVEFSAPLQCKVHQLSRTDCENILLKSATCCQYIIRESTKAGQFVLSVRSIDRVHHFPIKFTPEKTYFIGDYNFDTLNAVISYYSENPLFESENGLGITLGTSLDSF